MADPLQPIPTTQQPAGSSPRAVEELRRYVQALQKKPDYKNPFYTWANGLNDVTKDIFAGMAGKRADELERQGREGGASEWTRAMTPYLGGTPAQPAQPSSDAASGGAAPTVPFSPGGAGSDSGLAPRDYQRIAEIESGGNVNAKTGSNRGLYQFGPEEEKRFGINDSNRTDPEAQRRALDRESSAVFPKLTQASGRTPTGSDFYLAHQQGPAGSTALLNNPDKPAWKAVRQFYPSDKVAKQAIGGNLYGDATAQFQSDPDTFFARDMVDYWRRKYGGSQAPAGLALPAATAPGANGSATPSAAPGGPPSAQLMAFADQDAQAPRPPGGGPQLAQAGQRPPGAQPSPGATPQAPGQPQPLTSPVGQMTPEAFQRLMANPWVSEQQKAMVLQNLYKRGEVQTMPVEGGTLQYDAQGHRQFIPQPRFGKRKVGDIELDTVQRFNPATGHWTETPLQGGAAPTVPGGAPAGPGAQGAGVTAGPPAPAPRAASPPPTASAPPPAGKDDTGPPPPTAAAPAPAFPLGDTIDQQQQWLDDRKARAKAQETAATKQAEQDTQYYSNVANGTKGQRTVAAAQKVNIDTLRQYAQDPHLVTGPPGDITLRMQRMASSLGIGDSTKSASTPREMFNMLAAKVLADQFAGMKTLSTQEGEKGARIFKPMLDIEEKANITANDSVPGILIKLDFIDQLGDHQIRWGNAVNDYEKKYTKIGPEFEQWLMNDVAKTKITPREYKEPVLIDEHGNKEPMPARGGARSQAEAVGVLPGGTPQRGVTELTGAAPPTRSPPPRVPQDGGYRPGPGASMPVPSLAALGQKPPRGPYMGAEGQLVLPNDAVGNPEKWLEYTAPLVLPVEAGLGAAGLSRMAGMGPVISKLLGAGAGTGTAAAGTHGNEWGWILKLLGGEIAAKKAGLL